MSETKSVEPRTLCFIGNGHYKLISWKYRVAKSTFREGGEYVSGLYLTLGGQLGAVYEATVSKKDILFAKLEGLFISLPETKDLTFTWSEKDSKVIVTAAMPA